MGLTRAAHFEEIKQIRAEEPQAIYSALENRQRREVNRGDCRLLILAADHPARGAIAVGTDAQAMGSRKDLLDRFKEALSNPAVDGVLGTPDLIEDLALMGLLEDKIVVGSMNRGGLSDSSFEFDDRFTSYTIKAIKEYGLDFAKSLLRISLEDKETVKTLESTAWAVDAAVRHQVPIMIEPFMSSWVDGKVRNQLNATAVLKSAVIASGLGSSSAMSWLKLPVVDDMERVMEATTLPTLLLGGDVSEAREDVFLSWEKALGLPGVRGLVVGRSLLYPSDGDVSKAVAMAVQMVHPQNIGGV